MNETDLQDEILGDDVRIKADQRSLKEKFREWIEPILAVLVAGLIVVVVVLLVQVGDVKEDQTRGSDERARGSANVCRMLNALGLDVTQPGDRCQDEKVYAAWEQYRDERTLSVQTSGQVLDVACGMAIQLAVTIDGYVPPELCVERLQDG